MSTEDNRQTVNQEPEQEVEVTEEQLTEQRKIRREKLKALQNALKQWTDRKYPLQEDLWPSDIWVKHLS